MASFNNTTSSQCVALQRWIYIPLMPLPIISGCINIVIWLAATIYRKKLIRQNYVYLCVTSTLLSNVLFLSFQLWELFASFTLPPEMSVQRPSTTLRFIWTLCHAASSAMLYVICWNLSTLIYVMLDSTYFSIAVKSRPSYCPGNAHKTSPTRIVPAKRRKAILLIAMSWIVPAAFTLAAVLKWNCSDLCFCSLGAGGESCPRSAGCSRVWSPLANSFVGVFTALWFVEVICLGLFNMNGLQNFRKFNKKNRSLSIHDATASNVASNRAEDGGEKSTQKSERIQDIVPVPVSKTDSPDRNSIGKNTLPSQKKPSYLTRWIRSDPRVRLAAALSILFVLCSIPSVIVFFIDYSVDTINTTAARFTTGVIIEIYTLLCPIFIVKGMANLRSAVMNLFLMFLKCFCKTG
ncbi:uncharacterized protein LOC143464909 [Clavelina lepadiformis]|uniref:G-protein coupled receptors family 1 profile domain-containing protein n=1 Tax=Clavelina lepadiformis TaxID=159417 RepID=A0ABP0F1F7_CLALP